MLPAGDLQTDLPENLHVSTFLLQTQRLLQRRTCELCSQVRGAGPRFVRSSGCGPLCRSGSCDVRSSGSGPLRRPGPCDVRRSGSGPLRTRTGSDVRCTGSRAGSGQVLRCSGCRQVLRHRMCEEVLC